MTTTGPALALPADLAPAMRARVLDLLREVDLVMHVPTPGAPRRATPNRCGVCHRGGVLGGHHGEDGTVEWVHRSCHRRLHRRGRDGFGALSAGALPRQGGTVAVNDHTTADDRESR